MDFEWLRDTKNAFDLLQRGWNNWVIAFSSESQSRLFYFLGWGIFDSIKLVIAMIALVFIISTGIFLLAPWLLKFRASRKQDPLLQLWQKFIKKLKKTGIITHPSMGPRELAVSASSQLNYTTEGISRIVELYILCRYSPDSSGQTDLADLIDNFRPQPAISQQ